MYLLLYCKWISTQSVGYLPFLPSSNGRSKLNCKDVLLPAILEFSTVVFQKTTWAVPSRATNHILGSRRSRLNNRSRRNRFIVDLSIEQVRRISTTAGLLFRCLNGIWIAKLVVWRWWSTTRAFLLVLIRSLNDWCCYVGERICSFEGCCTSPIRWVWLCALCDYILFVDSESMAKIKPHIHSSDCLDPSWSVASNISTRRSRFLINSHST